MKTQQNKLFKYYLLHIVSIIIILIVWSVMPRFIQAYNRLCTELPENISTAYSYGYYIVLLSLFHMGMLCIFRSSTESAVNKWHKYMSIFLITFTFVLSGYLTYALYTPMVHCGLGMPLEVE